MRVEAQPETLAARPSPAERHTVLTGRRVPAAGICHGATDPAPPSSLHLPGTLRLTGRAPACPPGLPRATPGARLPAGLTRPPGWQHHLSEGKRTGWGKKGAGPCHIKE